MGIRVGIKVHNAECERCHRTCSHPWQMPALCDRCKPKERVGSLKLRSAIFKLVSEQPKIKHRELYNLLYKGGLLDWALFCSVTHNMHMQGLLKPSPDLGDIAYPRADAVWVLGDGESFPGY